MKKKFNRIKLWLIVHLNDWPVYRVTYQDGHITVPLHYREAKGCADTFNGQLWIDWAYADR